LLFDESPALIDMIELVTLAEVPAATSTCPAKLAPLPLRRASMPPCDVDASV